MQTDQTAVIAVLALIAVAAAVLVILYRSRRTAALRERFGAEEYERTLAERGARGKAERELLERKKRVAALGIRPLGPNDRERFAAEWQAAKARFVDDPAAAVLAADRAIGGVMAARGYPVADFDARYESLTVDHGEVARHYRAGHDIAVKQETGQATTEDLRQAMIHYEALFAELARDEPAVPPRAATLEKHSA